MTGETATGRPSPSRVDADACEQGRRGVINNVVALTFITMQEKRACLDEGPISAAEFDALEHLQFRASGKGRLPQRFH